VLRDWIYYGYFKSMHKFIGRTLLTWSVIFLLPPAWSSAHAAPAEETEEVPPAFDLLMFQVDGNTVLDQQLIEKTVYPFLGPGKSIEDVDKARQALEDVYRKNGYPTVIVEIPEQDVVNASVRLQVVEGTVERLKISGSRYYELGRIRTDIPALAAGKVPHMPEVQQQLTALNQTSPDRQVTPVFRAGDTPGKTEVELHVKDEVPLHGSLEVNGRNPESTSRTRLIGSLRYDNLWQRFHSASLQYQVSPENYDEVEVWSGTYVLPTGWADTRLALYGIGINSNTAIGTSVGGLTVVGSGDIYGARLIKPFGLQENVTHSLTLGFDYKSFNQGVTLQGQDMAPTPVSYPAFQIGYDGSWRQPGALTSLGAAANFSVRGLGSDPQEFENRRKDAPTNYAYLTANLKHLRELFWDFRLAARASGQLSYSPLISNEQFSAGGPTSVRGYHQTQQLGDDGLNASLELQSPLLKRQDWDFVDNLRLSAFIDYAYLWIQDPLPDTPSFYRLAGAGVGLHAQLFKHWHGEVEWAYPFYRQGTVDVGNQRIDFRLAYEF
jgi:hemolysin activation/secretion protein